VPHIVAKGSHSKYSPPVLQLVLLRNLNQRIANLIRHILWIRNYVEDPARQFHDTETMFEPLVRGCRINQVRQSQLVDVTKTLEWPRVQHCPFIRVHSDEDVDGTADFVQVLAQSLFGAGRRLQVFSVIVCIRNIFARWTTVSRGWRPQSDNNRRKNWRRDLNFYNYR
jgi:hypothetical protein